MKKKSIEKKFIQKEGDNVRNKRKVLYILIK
jgi:hypothetical protein